MKDWPSAFIYSKEFWFLDLSEVQKSVRENLNDLDLSHYRHNASIITFLKFVYSEKTTKFWKISNLLLSVCTVDKSKVKILKNFVAFSEYINFKCLVDQALNSNK